MLLIYQSWCLWSISKSATTLLISDIIQKFLRWWTFSNLFLLIHDSKVSTYNIFGTVFNFISHKLLRTKKKFWVSNNFYIIPVLLGNNVILWLHWKSITITVDWPINFVILPHHCHYFLLTFSFLYNKLLSFRFETFKILTLRNVDIEKYVR